MSKTDQEKWDKRFADKPLNVPKVPGFVEAQLTKLSTGRVLDVACGDGAAALALAGIHGNQVTALDVSSHALARLEQFAVDAGVAINLRQMDVDCEASMQALAEEAKYDLIVMCHFKPSSKLLKQLLAMLTAGGQLVLSTFNLRHHQQHGFSKRFCVDAEMYLPAPAGIDCLLYQSVERHGCFMDDYHFVNAMHSGG